jgi:hypothetical protein
MTGAGFKEENVAGGWPRDGAIQDQIDDPVKDAVLAARAWFASIRKKH